MHSLGCSMKINRPAGNTSQTMVLQVINAKFASIFMTHPSMSRKLNQTDANLTSIALTDDYFASKNSKVNNNQKIWRKISWNHGVQNSCREKTVKMSLRLKMPQYEKYLKRPLNKRCSNPWKPTKKVLKHRKYYISLYKYHLQTSHLTWFDVSFRIPAF